MDYIKLIDTDIDHELLYTEVKDLLYVFNLEDQQQVSLTSITGDNDWECTVGKIHLLDKPEKFYRETNNSIKGTYIEQLINRYSSYYRWRLLRLAPRECYSIHTDSNTGDKLNVRLHIPVITNPESFMCFFQQPPESGKNATVWYEHLSAGNSYKVNTTGLHTAINHGPESRYHLVGVKYENSNNWND